MADLFDVQCSIYADAKDNSGRFIDRDTGVPLQAMTIRDFCLTERWRPVVEQLRALVAEYGAEQAKARDDYSRLKHFLPGATLSGLFGLADHGRCQVLVDPGCEEPFDQPQQEEDERIRIVGESHEGSAG